ncbi:site-specific integrase [Zoogloea sp. 1C4]|uniref:tyrosine-type recombinase/integrase n=1 Tax=Zoogloea sp. 1C4 TaxID=2570190 RepID=UPI001291D29F|nr:site-specific integrase [Zoogloea sp. 1C4]
MKKKTAPAPQLSQPVAPPLVPIRPLDEIAIPADLDGRQGVNRADPARLQINADNDADAIRCFLAEYDRSLGTLRIYQRECERLLLWSLNDCGKPISSLNRQDFEGYLNFLADPQPAALWCGPKADRRTEKWRPFVGPLSESAVLTAIAAINSLMRYLVDAGYLAGNPLGLIRQRRRKMSAEAAGPLRAVASTDEVEKIERFLDAQMWQAVTAAIEAMPRDSERGRDEYERARFLAATLYMLAPRAGELESHRMNSFREERGLWWWHVVGKGGKKAKVPVADDMLQALIRYRKYLGLSAVPRRDDATPILVSVKDGSPITARRLNQILKKIFSAAAELLPADAEHKKEKLRAASAHWGRHTGITAKLDSGIDERYVQKDARHTDARTTQRYIHEEEERWHDEAQKQRLPWAGEKPGGQS